MRAVPRRRRRRWDGGACFPASYTGGPHRTRRPDRPAGDLLDGLLEFERATGGSAEVRTARRGGEEYLLERGLFRRKSTGVVVQPAYLEFAFPYYWHYDVLRALDYFRRSGTDPDPRMAEAVAVVQSKRQPGGRWLLDRIYPGRVHFDLEGAVGTPSRWNTLRAVRVLKWWDAIA